MDEHNDGSDRFLARLLSRILQRMSNAGMHFYPVMTSEIV